MNIATQYAKALFAIEKPSVSALKEVLARRGHQKLLPQIFTEYQKLQLQKERSEQYAKVTPQKERTRVLFDLYKKLTLGTPGQIN